jgi:RimJ/RimL family protein N-acetyltransferase
VTGGALETERLVLRPLARADVPALVALWCDPVVTRFLGGPRDPVAVRHALDSDLADRDAPSPYRMMPVFERATGRLIGDCGLIAKDVDGRSEVELIYVLAADAWGRGYATEAASAVRDDAMQRRGLRRLIALIDPDNAPSARVAEKIGMRFERVTVRPNGMVRHVYSMEASAST